MKHYVSFGRVQRRLLQAGDDCNRWRRTRRKSSLLEDRHVFYEATNAPRRSSYKRVERSLAALSRELAGIELQHIAAQNQSVALCWWTPVLIPRWGSILLESSNKKLGIVTMKTSGCEKKTISHWWAFHHTRSTAGCPTESRSRNLFCHWRSLWGVQANADVRLFCWPWCRWTSGNDDGWQCCRAQCDQGCFSRHSGFATFHLLQAIWYRICKDKHGIPQNYHPEMFGLVNQMMYCDGIGSCSTSRGFPGVCHCDVWSQARVGTAK